MRYSEFLRLGIFQVDAALPLLTVNQNLSFASDACFNLERTCAGIGKEEEKASQKTGNENQNIFFHIARIFLKESEQLFWEGHLHVVFLPKC